MTNGDGEKKKEEGRKIVQQKDDALLHAPVPGCGKGGSSLQSVLWVAGKGNWHLMVNSEGRANNPMWMRAVCLLDCLYWESAVFAIRTKRVDS